MKKNALRTLAQRLGDVTSATVSAQTEARAEIMEARTAIKDLRRQMTNAVHAPIPIDEARQRIRELVAIDGDRFLNTVGQDLILGEDCLTSPNVTHAGQVRLPEFGAALMTWPAYCAACPDQACALLEALLARVPYESGGPQADRPALIERLRCDLEQAEADEEAAVDALAAAGIVIEHRPDVIARRRHEQRQREYLANQEALLESTESRRLAGRTSDGQSQYLIDNELARQG